MFPQQQMDNWITAELTQMLGRAPTNDEVINCRHDHIVVQKVLQRVIISLIRQLKAAKVNVNLDNK